MSASPATDGVDLPLTQSPHAAQICSLAVFNRTLILYFGQTYLIDRVSVDALGFKLEDVSRC